MSNSVSQQQQEQKPKPQIQESPSQPQQQQPQNVVSLLGAATETLYRLGLGHHLIARSHECDYPPAVLTLPCISRPRLDVQTLSSAQIDATVRLNSASGEPIYRLDEEVLQSLERPVDLLIAQDHCRVCAVTPREIGGSESCRNVTQLVLRPATLGDCLDDVEKVAEAMGVRERGVRLRATLEERLERVRTVVAATTAATTSPSSSLQPKARPRVALLEWCDPIMGCGYWLPELVELAGGTPLHCPPPGGATPTISTQTLLDSKPDVIIFALCGFGLTRAASEIASSSWGKTYDSGYGSSRPSDPNSDAATEEDGMTLIERLTKLCGGPNNIFIIDGNYLVNRSGPRLIESAEALAEAIHPELLGHFGHFGSELLTTLELAMGLVADGTVTGGDKGRPAPFEEDLVRLRDASATNSGDGGAGTAGAGSKPNDTDTKLIGDETNRIAAGTPADAVTQQLTFLKSGNSRNAFAMNSIANRDRWCSPDRFDAVMRSHADFSRLLSSSSEEGDAGSRSSSSSSRVDLEPNAVVGESKVNGGVATVCVCLPEKKKNRGCEEGTEGNVLLLREVNLVWTMVAEVSEDSGEMVWRTEKVGVAR